MLSEVANKLSNAAFQAVKDYQAELDAIAYSSGGQPVDLLYVLSAAEEYTPHSFFDSFLTNDDYQEDIDLGSFEKQILDCLGGAAALQDNEDCKLNSSGADTSLLKLMQTYSESIKEDEDLLATINCYIMSELLADIDGEVLMANNGNIVVIDYS